MNQKYFLPTLILLLILPSAAFANSMGGSYMFTPFVEFFELIWSAFKLLLFIGYLIFLSSALSVKFLKFQSVWITNIFRIGALMSLISNTILFFIIAPAFFFLAVGNFLIALSPEESSISEKDPLYNFAYYATLFIVVNIGFFGPAYLIVRQEWTRQLKNNSTAIE